MVPERVEREILVDAPLGVVWAVITEPEHISSWSATPSRSTSAPEAS